jgi:hypothetical protein
MEQSITWSEYEFQEQEKSVDWFWALGIIALSAIVIAIIYKNYLFAIFVALSALTMGMLANQKPKLVTYTLSRDGLRINETLYPLDSLKGYAIREIKKGKEKILILESSKQFAPILTIPIEDHLITDIQKIFTPKVPEKDLHEPTAHQIMDAIGF